jgi:hypothetical protein
MTQETETLREAERQLSSDLDSIKIEVNSAGVRAADSQARNDVLIGSKESRTCVLQLLMNALLRLCRPHHVHLTLSPI